MPTLAEEYLQHIQEQEDLQEAGIIGNIGGIVLFGALGWAAWRTAAGVFSKAAKKCGTYTISNQRDMCMAKVRLQLAEKRAGIIKSAMAKCGESKNPAKCKDQGQQKLNKEMLAIKKQKAKMQSLTVQGRD